MPPPSSIGGNAPVVLGSPCQNPVVRELPSRTRKPYTKRGALLHKKQGLTQDLSTSGRKRRGEPIALTNGQRLGQYLRLN